MGFVSSFPVIVGFFVIFFYLVIYVLSKQDYVHNLKILDYQSAVTKQGDELWKFLKIIQITNYNHNLDYTNF